MDVSRITDVAQQLMSAAVTETETGSVTTEAETETGIEMTAADAIMIPDLSRDSIQGHLAIGKPVAVKKMMTR